MKRFGLSIGVCTKQGFMVNRIIPLSQKMTIVLFVICFTRLSLVEATSTKLISTLYRRSTPTVGYSHVIDTTCVCQIQQTVLHVLANCTGLGLHHVPECVPDNTNILYLSMNIFNEVKENTFRRFSNLRELYLDFNSIERLYEYSFSGLSQLTDLSISVNNLQYKYSYADNVFKPLQNLKRLWLQGNCNPRKIKTCQYPETALAGAQSVQYLHIDGLPGTSLGHGFASLKLLQTLRMSRGRTVENVGYGYCSMTHITKDTLAPLRLTPLTYLEIDNCDIYQLDPNVFRGLWNLTMLTFTNNRHLCTKGLYNATIGLNTTAIRVLRLTNFCKQPPYFNVINKDEISKELQNTSLEILDISGNRIVYVNPSFVDELPKTLRNLSFRDNILGKLNFMPQLKTFDKIKTLDLSYQSDFESNVTVDKIVSTQQILSSKLRVIDTDMNKSQQYLPLVLPPNIETLYMGHIVTLKGPLPKLIAGPNKLKYLDISRCLLSALLGPWIGLKYLEFLNLSYNNIDVMDPLSFSNLTNLTSLLLQGNKIGNQIMHGEKLFSYSKKLEVLDISDNSMKNLPTDIFASQRNLRTLLVSDNSLTNIDFKLQSLTKLEYIDLSKNDIKEISTENINFMDSISEKSTLKMNLSGNTLLCNCNNHGVIDWLSVTKVFIVDMGKLRCVYENKSVLSLSRIQEIKYQLFYDCSAWLVLTSCVVGFVVILLLASLFAVMYHKRWKLRYLLYIGRENINPYHPLEEEHIVLDIDVYISYEMSDIMHNIVTNYIHPYFKDKGYNVKIREELDPAKPLHKTISEVVRTARKLIIILTQDCFNDYWNTFEFNMSALEGIHTKRNLIIPVIVGKVDSLNMPPEIASFIRAKLRLNDVLRFPLNFDLDKTEFLQRLEMRLHH